MAYWAFSEKCKPVTEERHDMFFPGERLVALTPRFSLMKIGVNQYRLVDRKESTATSVDVPRAREVWHMATRDKNGRVLGPKPHVEKHSFVHEAGALYTIRVGVVADVDGCKVRTNTRPER